MKPESKATQVKDSSVSDEEYRIYKKFNPNISKADYAKWKAENG